MQCSEVIRKVVVAANGCISIDTTGFGSNRYPKVNKHIAAVIFSLEDLAIQDSIFRRGQNPGLIGPCVDD